MKKIDEKTENKKSIEKLAKVLAESPEEEDEAAQIIADVIPLINRLLSLKK